MIIIIIVILIAFRYQLAAPIAKTSPHLACRFTGKNLRFSGTDPGEVSPLSAPTEGVPPGSKNVGRIGKPPYALGTHASGISEQYRVQFLRNLSRSSSLAHDYDYDQDQDHDQD